MRVLLSAAITDALNAAAAAPIADRKRLAAAVITATAAAAFRPAPPRRPTATTGRPTAVVECMTLGPVTAGADARSNSISHPFDGRASDCPPFVFSFNTYPAACVWPFARSSASVLAWDRGGGCTPRGAPAPRLVCGSFKSKPTLEHSRERPTRSKQRGGGQNRHQIWNDQIQQGSSQYLAPEIDCVKGAAFLNRFRDWSAPCRYAQLSRVGYPEPDIKTDFLLGFFHYFSSILIQIRHRLPAQPRLNRVEALLERPAVWQGLLDGVDKPVCGRLVNKDGLGRGKGINRSIRKER